MNIYNLYQSYLIKKHNIVPPEPTYKGLAFQAIYGTVNIKYVMSTTTMRSKDIKYSYDTNIWYNWQNDTNITLQNNEIIYVKGNNPDGLGYSIASYIIFQSSTPDNGRLKASGNVTSLLDDNDGTSVTTIPTIYCFYKLFYENTLLISAPELPSIELKKYCYNRMFYGCSNLITAMSQLPAINAVENCYSGMFSYCSNLIKAPEIFLLNIVNGSCTGFFMDCNNLNYIKMHYKGYFYQDYFINWVRNVSSTGDFYYNGDDTQRGNDHIPYNWTIHKF